MDRRTALRLLGASGVAVATAGTITTRPAFAYAGPVLGFHLTSSSSNSGAAISLNVQPGSGTCSGSSTSADGPEVVSLDITLTTVSCSAHFGAVGTTVLSNAAARTAAAANDFTSSPYSTQLTSGIAAGLTTVFYLRKITVAPLADSAPSAGDAFHIDITATYRCSYLDGTGSATERIQGTYTWAGAGQPWSYVAD